MLCVFSSVNLFCGFLSCSPWTRKRKRRNAALPCRKNCRRRKRSSWSTSKGFSTASNWRKTTGCWQVSIKRRRTKRIHLVWLIFKNLKGNRQKNVSPKWYKELNSVLTPCRHNMTDHSIIIWGHFNVYFRKFTLLTKLLMFTYRIDKERDHNKVPAALSVPSLHLLFYRCCVLCPLCWAGPPAENTQLLHPPVLRQGKTFVYTWDDDNKSFYISIAVFLKRQRAFEEK